MIKTAILAITLLCLLTSNGDTGKSETGKPYEGETNVLIDDRSFVLEDLPETPQEEVVVMDFYYTITADFERVGELLSDTEEHRIITANMRRTFEEGRYIAAYTVHQIRTLSAEEYASEFNEDGTHNPLYYYGLDERVEEYALEEYVVVHAIYTMTWSEKATEAGSQIGDGTYGRNFLVGKSASDDTSKIYEFGMM